MPPMLPWVQLAYVVTDIRDAIQQWTTKLGVGPFCLMENVRYAEHEVNGRQSRPSVHLAFAYSGDLQIELIQPLDDEPSAFNLYPASSINGIHHVGRFSSDMAGDEARLAASGMRPVGSSVSEVGVRVAFFHGGPQAGGLVELIRADAPVLGFFAALKQAAADWDGKTPFWQIPS